MKEKQKASKQQRREALQDLKTVEKSKDGSLLTALATGTVLMTFREKKEMVFYYRCHFFYLLQVTATDGRTQDSYSEGLRREARKTKNGMDNETE